MTKISSIVIEMHEELKKDKSFVDLPINEKVTTAFNRASKKINDLGISPENIIGISSVSMDTHIVWYIEDVESHTTNSDSTDMGESDVEGSRL